TATFTRSKNILTLKVALHGADPGTYTLYLIRSARGACGHYWQLGTFRVGADGYGLKVGSADVSGCGNYFFAAPYNNTTQFYSESDVVKVLLKGPWGGSSAQP